MAKAEYSLAPVNDPLLAVKRDDFDLERNEKDGDPELKQYGGKYDKKFAIGQVTIRLPEYNVINWIALVYGFLPFIIPGMLFIEGFVYNRFMGRFGFAMALICVIINELVFKPIIRDPRPKESANKYKDGTMKPGMPSGHVLNAGTLFVWSFLELLYSTDVKDERTRLHWFILVSVVMVPVPWARWHNRDHSLAQCGVSLILGTIAGVVGTYIRRTYFPHHWQPWEQSLF